MKLVQEIDLKKKSLFSTYTLEYCQILSFMYASLLGGRIQSAGSAMIQQPWSRDATVET